MNAYEYDEFMRNNKGTIYMIECSVDYKKYIGQTTKTLERRWQEHTANGLRCINGSTKTRYNTRLYCAMKEHGIDKFSIKELFKVALYQLNDIEIKTN